MSNLKGLLNENGVTGIFLNIPDPSLAEILGYIGFDFVVIDCEHGAIGMKDMSSLIRAVDSTGSTAVVRVAKGDDQLASQALDFGAGGVQFSSISSAEDAECMLTNTFYPPIGDRGASFYTRAARYTLTERDQAMSIGDQDIVRVLQIESLEGLQDLDQIAAVHGIDILFFGPTDYTISQRGKDNVAYSTEEAALKVLETANKHQISAGIFVKDVDDARKRKQQGFSYIALAATPIIVKALSEVRKSLDII